MLLKKEVTTIPEGSPILDESIEKRVTIPNGRPAGNGFTTNNMERVPTSVPLQVEINGLRESGLSSPLTPDLRSLASSALPTPREQSSNNSTCTILPKGDLIPDSSEQLNLNGSSSVRMTSKKEDGVPLSNVLSGIPLSRKDIEVSKRRQVADKISRFKDQGSISYLVPQCESLTPIQLAIMTRTMKDSLPNNMRKYVFGEDEPPKKVLKTLPSIGDVDEMTDLSDMEMEEPENILQSSVRWAPEKVRYGGADARLVAELEDRYSHMQDLVTLERSLPQTEFEAKEDECARTRALVSRAPRKIFHHQFSLMSNQKGSVDYSQMQPSTSKDSDWHDPRTHPRITLSEVHPIERRMQAYTTLLSLVPSCTIRKSFDSSPWLNMREIEEEKQRNGWRRCAVRERRRMRIEERNQNKGNDSSDYEDTDQSDDDCMPKAPPLPKPKYERKEDKRRRRGRPPKDREGKDPPMGLTKIGRRHSMPTSARQSRQYDIDEYLPDFGTAHLPQKFDYKEIAIPNWHNIVDEGTVVEKDPSSENCEFCHVDLLLTIAQKHHFQEFEERQRFKIVQAHRDKAARDKREDRELSVVGSDPPSGQHTPQPVTIPPFDPKAPVLPAQKVSCAIPYSPRHFLV
ncbi:unnamed protein product [Auanema sp. JU1783]|nr:unnamed protein product [Auanema sp. JU1783]